MLFLWTVSVSVLQLCEIWRKYVAFNGHYLEQWRTDWGGSKPPEIPKALQNRAKLNPIVKTVKNCRI